MVKCETQYKPQVYQGRRGQYGCDNRPNNYHTRNRSCSRHTSYRGRRKHDRNLVQAIRVDLEITTDEKDTGKVIGMSIQGNIMATKGIIIGKIMVEVITGKEGIEVQGGTVTEITTEAIQEKDMTEVEIQVEIRVEKDSQGQALGWKQKVEGLLIDQEQNQGPDLDQGSAQIEIGLDVTGAESRITLQESVPTLSQIRTQIIQNKSPCKCWLRTTKLTLPLCFSRMFKHVKGKNSTTSFLPLDGK